ncbi:hypothetical protein [Staphylococcus phage vB_StaM_PB50]|nr:hypothetical protein [Staphylococcus phage vB_StaM_PB50]
MGMELSIYGINKSHQRNLDWYIKNKRYINKKNHLFELELYKPHELFKVLSENSTIFKDDEGYDVQVISESNLKELMKKELKEDNFDNDLTKYYKLMLEIFQNRYYLESNKHNFYLVIDASF